VLMVEWTACVTQTPPSPLPLSAVGDDYAAMNGEVEKAKKLIAEGANVDAVEKVRCARFYSTPAGVAGLPALSQQLNVARCVVCPLTGARNRCVVCECMHG